MLLTKYSLPHCIYINSELYQLEANIDNPERLCCRAVAQAQRRRSIQLRSAR